jgi:predicted metal-binding membrane protein
MARSLEAILRRDRAVVGAGVAGISALAWVYLLRLGTADMDASMAMPDMRGWGPVDALLLLAMWVVMMVATMLPAASPMILMFTTVNGRRTAEGRAVARTGLFVLGYVVVWSGYSVLAALVQWALHARALLSPAMMASSPYFGGGLLVAAGIFQWTPLKRACLRACRSPLSFLMTEWREGAAGALVMGLRHGAYCVGCCWALMALLFVAGVMNLAWVAAIAVFVLVEKVVPGGEGLGRVAGLLLIAAGLMVAAG